MHAPTFLKHVFDILEDVQFQWGLNVSWLFQRMMCASNSSIRCHQKDWTARLPNTIRNGCPQNSTTFSWGRCGTFMLFDVLGTIILDKPLTKEFYLGWLVKNHSYQRFRYSFCGWLHHQPEIAIMEAESWTRGQGLSLAQSRKSNPWQWRSLAPLATFTWLSCSV